MGHDKLAYIVGVTLPLDPLGHIQLDHAVLGLVALDGVGQVQQQPFRRRRGKG